MAESQTKVREVSWTELFPWLMLLRSVRIALMARVLVLGAVGLVVTWLGLHLLWGMCSHSDPVSAGWETNTRLGIWVDAVPARSEHTWLNTTPHSAGEVFDSAQE